MIYVLYGQPGSGKTSLGKLLASHLDTPFIIDGDEFREMFTNTNYCREGREENIRNANAVATYLNKRCAHGYPSGFEKFDPTNHVVISLVNPYKHLRKELEENNEGEVIEVLLQSNRELRKEYHVEDFEEGVPNTTMNTDNDLEHSWIRLKDRLEL